MQVANFLHMNSGNEESSYATNSCVQETAIRNVQPILKEAVNCIANLDGFPHCFNIADLGCSSGTNTLLVVSNIMDEVHKVCKENNLKVPQFQVCLNDLFGNDFNSIFKSLPTFYEKHNKEIQGESSPCLFVSAVPGSFHRRLFPDQSMHFFHSSSSLHWLSQVPNGLENNGLNIYMAKTSPPNVFEIYRMQFEKDFTSFLESRSAEIIRGGRMVLAFQGRSDIDPSSNDCCRHWELLAKSLVDMTKEGYVKEAEIRKFNIPMYNPYKDEVRDLIHYQGSFSLDIFESFQINWDPYDPHYENSKSTGIHGKRVAKILRAVAEPMLVTHFGDSAMDFLFKKYETYVDLHLLTEKTKHFVIVISLTKV
ncbi:S-adenosyl-L-methionine-dependent methyltransferases superfamily protein [Artemisia annua]|uniref:S-adenosyl-L-methionine-dependent methyltransferases superfamily protein n=1 Tax=Artemisia annua TaxID=35608 RepID=A0A2U1LGR9_ARTAN|nr:S-adenosyl-L-methionine-dependent methyltransferases superfamily protein [Artemisia annua]